MSTRPQNGCAGATAESRTQSKIEPVSTPRLRKTGIFHIVTRDFPQKLRFSTRSRARQRLAGLSTSAARAAFFNGWVKSKSGDRTGWLAQQWGWPPALPVFPANREFYREFCKIAASGAPEIVNNGLVTGRSMRIPYSKEQGIIYAEQGLLAREQRILSVGIEIIAG